MKTKRWLQYSGAFISLMFLIGCATTSSESMQRSWNKVQAEKKSPLRLVVDHSQSDSQSVVYVQDWAGKPGETAMSEEYQQEVAFLVINQLCGYGEQEFIEARIVNHFQTRWQEVWLFHDPASAREDKVSGLTLYFQQSAGSETIEMELFGDCHTGKRDSLSFSQ